MGTSEWIALLALGVALGSWLGNRRALAREQRDREESIALLRRQVAGESAAHLVAEALGEDVRAMGEGVVEVTFRVRNAGRSAARDVSVDVVRLEGGPKGLDLSLADVQVAAALFPGDREPLMFELPRVEVEQGGLLVVGYWEDDNGRQQRDLGWLDPDDIDEGPQIF